MGLVVCITNITIDFIEKNIDKIDFNHLSFNKFTLQNRLIRIDKLVYSTWVLLHILDKYDVPYRHIVEDYI